MKKQVYWLLPLVMVCSFGLGFCMVFGIKYILNRSRTIPIDELPVLEVVETLESSNNETVTIEDGYPIDPKSSSEELFMDELVVPTITDVILTPNKQTKKYSASVNVEKVCHSFVYEIRDVISGHIVAVSSNGKFNNVPPASSNEAYLGRYVFVVKNSVTNDSVSKTVPGFKPIYMAYTKEQVQRIICSGSSSEYNKLPIADNAFVYRGQPSEKPQRASDVRGYIDDGIWNGVRIHDITQNERNLIVKIDIEVL